MTARTTRALNALSLDLRKPMEVAAVRVDGVPAVYTQRGSKVAVAPEESLAVGARFKVKVRYRGSPEPLEFVPAGKVGWIKQRRSVFVANEPHAASTWYPVNDHPLDKATYAVKARVPRDLTAVSNGELVSARHRGRHRVFRWANSEPMASYLVTLTIGRFQTSERSLAGVPAFIAWKRSTSFNKGRLVRKYRKILRFLSKTLGPYPFSSTGAIVFGELEGGSYVLETQTRPLFQEDPFKRGNELLAVHELAHQWFGNSVTHSAWDELWLNEGFSQWVEWLWRAEVRGRTSLEQQFEKSFSLLPRRGVPIGAIEHREQIADGTIYIRGAMTLEALRQRVGDETFGAILRAWLAENQYGNVTTEDFIALSERESGLDLGHFFDVWLFSTDAPRDW